MTESKEAVRLSDSLEECKAKIKKLVRQNEMLISDIARKDDMLHAEHQKEH